MPRVSMLFGLGRGRRQDRHWAWCRDRDRNRTGIPLQNPTQDRYWAWTETLRPARNRVWGGSRNRKRHRMPGRSGLLLGGLVVFFGLALAAGAQSPTPEAPASEFPGQESAPLLETNPPLSDQDQPQSRITLPLLVEVSGGASGYVEGDLLADGSNPRLSRAGLQDLLPELFAGSPGMISLEELRAEGIEAEFDSGLLQVILTPPVSSEVRVVSLTGEGSGLFGVAVAPAPVSGYLNAEAALTLDTLNQKDLETILDLELEPVFNLYNWVAESRFQVITGQEPVLHTLMITHDQPEPGLRLRLGLLEGAESPFGSGPALWGVHLGRIPSLVPRSPDFSLELTQTRDFSLEIQVNGRDLRRLSYPPGSYRITGLPLLPGLNQVNLTLDPESGPGETVPRSVIVPYDNRLLPHHYADFGVQLGLPRQDLGPPVFTGMFRYGYTPVTTGDLYLQAGELGQLYGSTWVFGTPVGIFSLGVAGTTDLVQELRSPGGALQAGYRFALPGRISVPRISLDARYQSPSFAPYGQNPLGGLSLSAGVAQNLFGSLWLSASVSHENRGALERTRASLVLTTPITQALDLRVTGSLTFSGGQVDPRLLINLTASGLDVPITMGVSRNAVDGSVGFSGSHTGRFGDSAYGLSTSAGGLPLGDSADSLTLSASLSDQRFASGLQYQLQNTGSRVSARFASALAFAGSALTVSKPIRESFVIIRNTRSLAGYRLVVNPRESTYRAASDLLGWAVLSDVTRYRQNRIVIDLPQAPTDLPLGTTQYVVKPGYRSGTVIDIGGSETLRLRGRLLGPGGEALALQGGYLQSLADDSLEELFYTDEQGYFEIPFVPGGSYRLGLFLGGPGPWTIEIPQDAKEVYDLGPLGGQAEEGDTPVRDGADGESEPQGGEGR